MGRRFSITPGQSRGMMKWLLLFFVPFVNSHIREAGQWTGFVKMERPISVDQSGLPPEVVLHIPPGPNRNRPFPLTFDRSYRNFWHNREHCKRNYKNSSKCGKTCNCQSQLVQSAREHAAMQLPRAGKYQTGSERGKTVAVACYQNPLGTSY